VKESRSADPRAAIVDSLSMNAARKIVGRRRSIVTETLGRLLAVIVIVASVTENRAGIQVLDQVKVTYPTITKT